MQSNVYRELQNLHHLYFLSEQAFHIITIYNKEFRCIKKLDRRIGNNAQARLLVDMYTVKKINEVSKIASNLIPHDGIADCCLSNYRKA